MSWFLVGSLAAISLALRGAGHLALGDRVLGARAERRLYLVALSLLGAVIASQALTTEGALAVDARALGMCAAVAAAFLRAPLLAIFLVATVVTASARVIGVT
ncbi:MAG: AzlD domain-containing protein [Acidimicrobiales bacterium]|nr:AzlD domain-containing protein [Acidimicrobiales bacterium]